MSITITKYQIRAGSPQPVGNGCPPTVPSSYVYQTFGATKIVVDVEEAVTELKKSEDLQGQKPTQDVEDPYYIETTYSRISYSGRPLRTTDGTMVFTENAEHIEEFVDEDVVPGWS